MGFFKTGGFNFLKISYWRNVGTDMYVAGCIKGNNVKINYGKIC